jgi:hypothetical protein
VSAFRHALVNPEFRLLTLSGHHPRPAFATR